MTEVKNKIHLRKVYSEKRAAVVSKSKKDAAITDIVTRCETVQSADIILLYASFGSEVSTEMILDKLLKSGKTVALPKCGNDGKMTFHIITSMDQTSVGKYGITEPDVLLPVPVYSEKTVAIVPGLAFTENGGRLGYGGGYYDRFLAEFPFIYTIGVTYEELIADSLPCLSHDLTVCALATEERMVLCCAE